MKDKELRAEIRKILQSFFEPDLKEYGGAGSVLNNKFLYPFGSNKFPHYEHPQTPQDLAADTDKEFNINQDDYEEYRNRDAVTVFPVFPAQ